MGLIEEDGQLNMVDDRFERPLAVRDESRVKVHERTGWFMYSDTVFHLQIVYTGHMLQCRCSCALYSILKLLPSLLDGPDEITNLVSVLFARKVKRKPGVSISLNISSTRYPAPTHIAIIPRPIMHTPLLTLDQDRAALARFQDVPRSDHAVLQQPLALFLHTLPHTRFFPIVPNGLQVVLGVIFLSDLSGVIIVLRRDKGHDREVGMQGDPVRVVGRRGGSINGRNGGLDAELVNVSSTFDVAVHALDAELGLLGRSDIRKGV
jgi:hypothetical protein